MSDAERSDALDLRERVEEAAVHLHGRGETIIAAMLRDLRAENDALRDWKESAMRTMAEYDKLRELLGEPHHLGKHFADAAVDEITRLRTENAALRDSNDAFLIRAEKTVLDYQRFLEQAKARATRYREMLERAADWCPACSGEGVMEPDDAPEYDCPDCSWIREALQAQTEEGE